MRPSVKFGARIVDGVRWHWFCGKACSGAEQGKIAAKGGWTAVAQAANRRKGRMVVLSRLVALTKPHVDADGRVDPKKLVEVMYRELMRQRTLAASDRYYRRGQVVVEQRSA